MSNSKEHLDKWNDPGETCIMEQSGLTKSVAGDKFFQVQTENRYQSPSSQRFCPHTSMRLINSKW